MQKSKISAFVSKACTHFDDTQYNARIKHYTDKSRPELRDFIQFLFNAAERYIETGTVQHINNAINAGRGQARYNISVRIMKTVSAHAWNGKKFAGKMNTKVRAKKLSGWKHSFMVQVQAEIDRDAKQANEAPAWDLDAKILALFKAAQSEKHGSHTAKEVLDHAAKIAKELAA